jgi:nucleotide-binding universal stress UspA family protein
VVYPKILVPVDGSDESYAGLREAIRIAKQLGSHVRLLHVVDELVLVSAYGAALTGETIELMRADGKAILEQARLFTKRQGTECECELVERIGAKASDCILEHAEKWGASLIVMGTHGRHGLARLAIGSDAEAVVRNAAVPVLLVHARVHAGAGRTERTAVA